MCNISYNTRFRGAFSKQAPFFFFKHERTAADNVRRKYEKTDFVIPYFTHPTESGFGEGVFDQLIESINNHTNKFFA